MLVARVRDRAPGGLDGVGEDGGEVRATPAAQKDPLKGQYYKHDSFQVISAGPDCLFNTEDDIYNFERE